MHVKRILNRFLAVVTGLLIFPIVLAAECGLNNTNNCFDDWVESPETNKLCGGYYVEAIPPFPGQSMTVLPSQPATITADRAQLIPGGWSTLQGNVHLIQGNRQLMSDEANIYRNPKTSQIETIKAQGQTKILEPGFKVTGPLAEVFVEEDRKVIYNADYRLYGRHARGTACKIETFGKQYMTLNEASYTTCAPNQNTWHLKASTVTLDKVTGRGQAKHARMYFKNVPIFYAPYLDFPIDDRRKTGFLYPIFGSTSNSGVEFATPFYWNLAPNYDATLTPRYLSRRGFEIQGATRYISRNSTGNVHAAVLPHDRAYQKFRKQALKNPEFNERDPRVQALKRGNDSRRSLFARHITTFNRHVAARYHYDTVSDDNYFMDLGTTLNVASTTQLLQQGELAYQDLYWKGLFRMQQFQTLHPYKGPITSDPYRRLPQLSAFNSVPDLPLGFVWTTGADFTHFTHKLNPWTGLDFTEGDRFQMRPGISLPISSAGWFLKPRLQWNLWGYSLDLSHFDAKHCFRRSPTVNLPIFDFDSGLIFERDLFLGQTPYLQTLEPRAYYLWVPYRNQNGLPNFDTAFPGFDYNQLFRENRFSGLDRVGDANQLTLALTSRFLREDTGAERASITLGQIFYFQERKVTLCDSRLNPLCIKRELPNHKHHRSNYVGQGRYHLHDVLTANAIAQWNPYKNHWDEGLTWLQYQPDDLNVLNFGYLYLRHNPAQLDPVTGLPTRLSQTDTSFALALNPQWRILGRYQYDIRLHRTNQILAGIEYQGCCTALRLSVVRYIEPNDFIQRRRKYQQAIFLQFVFKGFAGIGHNNLSSTLSRSIPGYQWQRDRF